MNPISQLFSTSHLKNPIKIQDQELPLDQKIKSAAAAALSGLALLSVAILTNSAVIGLLATVTTAAVFYGITAVFKSRISPVATETESPEQTSEPPQQDISPVDAAMEILEQAGLIDEENRDRFEVLFEDSKTLNLQTLHQLHRANLLTEQILRPIQRHSDIECIILCIETLSSTNLLNEENLNYCLTHPQPLVLTDILKHLDEAGLLDEEALSSVKKHENFFELRDSIRLFATFGILDQNNFIAALSVPYPRDASRAICTLQKAGILNDESRDLVFRNREHNALASILEIIEEVNCLDQNSFWIVVNHNELRQFKEAVILLKDSEILNADTLGDIGQVWKTKSLAECLVQLSEAGLLTEETRRASFQNSEHYHLSCILSQLAKADILNAENFQIAVHHNDTVRLRDALSSLEHANLLTEGNFQIAARHENINSLAHLLDVNQGLRCLNQDSFIEASLG